MASCNTYDVDDERAESMAGGVEPRGLLRDLVLFCEPGAQRFPALRIVRYVHEVGKHCLSPTLLRALARCRPFLTQDAISMKLLDCVLDKHEDRFDYRSYLALPLVRLIGTGPDTVGCEARLVAILLADLVRFEARVADGGDPRLPERRPDADRRTRRLRHALRLVRKLAGRPGDGSSFELTPAELEALPGPTDSESGRALRYSLLPTGVQHDEYLFIRVIQSYEVVFGQIERGLLQAMERAEDGRVTAVATCVDRVARALEDVAGLFSLLATMQPEAFRTFRALTDGAGAIQSTTYKRIELLCGLPTSARLNSMAFRSVPDVHQQALRDPESLSSWYLRSVHRFADRDRSVVDGALARLENAHQRWKRTHYTLASAMIGERGGSGGTDGVSYLRECLDNRLFWDVGARCPHDTVHARPNLVPEVSGT